MAHAIFLDATDAIKHALADGQRCVGYKQGAGWIIYDPTNVPAGIVPEFFCIRSGTLPIPLSETATEVLESIIRRAGFS
jgi:hypothetical protein